MNLFAKLAVIAGSAAVMVLPMTGTAFANTSGGSPSCTYYCTPNPDPTSTWKPAGQPTDPTWHPTDKPTDHPTYDPNKNNGGGYGDPGKNKCDTQTWIGADVKHGMQPNDCYPTDPNRGCLPTPIRFTAGDVKGFQPNCYPQDPRGCSTDTWNTQRDSWNNDGNCYAPKPPVRYHQDSYRQDSYGCQWQDQGNGWKLTGYDSQGRMNDGRNHGSDGYNCDHGTQGYHNPGKSCTDKFIEFYFSKTSGTWLYEITTVTLHDGQNLTYDGQTWTVEDWTTTGHGAQGIGTYFTLVRNGHTLWGGQEQIGVAHTICTTPRSFV
jgi:hypothetical protein